MKRVFALLLISTLSVLGQSPPEQVQKSLTEGTAARTKQDFSAAEKDYLDALSASSSDDEYRSLFYLGLNKQEEASAAAARGEAAAASALRNAAADYYQHALHLKSTSTSAILNLALVDLDRGETDDAVALLKRGLDIASESSAKARFAEKLGDLQTDPSKALDFYRTAAAGKPSSTINSKITRSLLVVAQKDPERQSDVIEYGWKLFETGDLDNAIDTALSAIDSEPQFSSGNAAEMLTLATAALARKNYDGVTFAGSDALRRFSAMHMPEALRARIKSLLQLYQGDLKDAGVLAVWRDESDLQRPYGRPTALQSVQQVAHGLGYAAQRAKDFDRAERFYRLAIEVDPAHPDATTLRDLATLYYTRNRLSDVQQLLNQFEASLYSAKGGAYEHVDWEHVAEYHRTLGTMYSSLHRDADAKTQFERAFEAVKHENEKRKETNRTDLLEIDPTVRLQYADTLNALNEHDLANSERLAAAGACSSTGKIDCVRDAVAHIARTSLKSPTDLASFQKYLDESVVFIEPPNSPSLDFEALKSQLALFSSDPNPVARKKAEDALRVSGITSVTVENGHGSLQFGSAVMRFELPNTVPKPK